MRRPLLTLGALGVTGLVLVPAVGVYLAWKRPPGLFEPPPLSLDRVLPLGARTLALAALVSLLALALGTWLGWVEQRARYRGRRWLSLLTLLPLAVPSYLMATILREVFAPGGWLGEPLGLEGRFTGFWPAVLVLTLSTAPYVQILVGATLARFPESTEEAARALGASPWRRFVHLYVPFLRPTWAFSLVIIALYVISDFGAVAVLDCEVLVWELYRARGGKDAAVLGFGLMLLVIPMLAGVRLLHGKAHPEISQSHRTPTRVPLQRAGLWGTLSLQTLVIGLGAALPVAALTHWLIAGLVHDAPFAPLGGALWDTLWIAALGAFFTLVIGLIPAWRTARQPDRLAPFIEHGTWLTGSVPGVLVAYGILQVLLQIKRSLGAEGLWTTAEGLGLFLFAGYAMRYGAEAYGALKPSILRLDPRQEESARSLGASRLRRFFRISLPALAPGVAAAYILVFLALLKELPITLMLTPLGSQTLAFRVFDAQQEGSLPDVGLAGLTLLGLALVVQVGLLRWRRHV